MFMFVRMSIKSSIPEKKIRPCTQANTCEHSRANYMCLYSAHHWEVGQERSWQLRYEFRGPISQRHFLYVGYTYLEWLLTPLGLNTPHAAAAQLMKHIAYFIGHRLFIYIYYPSQLCFSFLHLACPPLSLPCHSNFLFLHFFPPLLFSVAKGK